MNLLPALVTNFAILIAIMAVLWLVSVKIRDVSFIDAFWGAGMALMAATSILQRDEPGALAWLIFAITAMWGMRLGIHLILRWHKEGEDKRYKKILGSAMKNKGWSFAKAALLKAWVMQMPLLFIVCLPAQIGILLSGDTQPGVIAIIGAIIAITGLMFETIGDAQLKAFKENPANDGKVMDKGLWRYTRHPNYFGDACTWWGIWIMAATTGWPAWVAIIGPIFLTFTLVKWSGAALLERGMKDTRPKYAEYKEKTSAFIPWPPKK